jgi:DNA-directed RNA polymerase specialized sigma subunit
MEGNFLDATADEVIRLGKLLAQVPESGSDPVRHALRLTRELDKVVDELRERAVIAALTQRKLTLREIGQLVGLSAPQVMARARAAGIDTSKPPAGSPVWKPRK